jgi:hypothetical protein
MQTLSPENVQSDLLHSIDAVVQFNYDVVAVIVGFIARPESKEISTELKISLSTLSKCFTQKIPEKLYNDRPPNYIWAIILTLSLRIPSNTGNKKIPFKICGWIGIYCFFYELEVISACFPVETIHC